MIVVMVFFLLCIAVLVVGNGLIHCYAKQTQEITAIDTVVILGAQIEGNPLRPSLVLQYRLDSTLRFYQKNPKVTIVVTGGKATGFAKSEAEVMQEYLVDHGVLASQIILEDQSTRTAHQFVNAKKLMSLGHVLVVTNDFHLLRSVMLAKRSGIEQVSGLAAPTPNDSGSMFAAHIREPFALLNSWLFDHPEG